MIEILSRDIIHLLNLFYCLYLAEKHNRVVSIVTLPKALVYKFICVNCDAPIINPTTLLWYK